MKIHACLSQNVAATPMPDRPDTPGPRIYHENGLELLQNESARQLVVFSHGSWKARAERGFPYRSFLPARGDGLILGHQGPRVDFYAEDGATSKGMSILNEISARPVEALTRLEPCLGRSMEQMVDLAAMYRRTVEEMVDMLMASAIGCREQVFPGDTVKDYALYHHDGNDTIRRRFFEQDIHPDVDIALVTEPSHKRHLSDVIKAAQNSGVVYEVIHVAACRVDRSRSLAIEHPLRP